MNISDQEVLKDEDTQTVTFRSEQERLDALDAIPEAPPADVEDKDAWLREMEQKEDDVMRANIDPAFEGENSLAIGEESEKEKPEEKPEEDLPYREPVIEPVKEKTEPSSEVLAKIDEMNIKMDAMRAENEKLLSSKTEQESIDAGASAEKEMKDAQSVYDDLMDEIEAIEEEDPDQANVLTRKALRASQRLQVMRDNLHNEKLGKFDELRKSQEEAETKRVADAEKQKDIDSQNVENEKNQRVMANSIDDFGNKVSELKMTKDFKEVENDYVGWITEATAANFGTSVGKVTSAQCEQTVANFLDRTPFLMETLEKKGIVAKAPKDMRKYLINTELYLLTKGQEIDSKTGQIVQRDWKAPDMESAYDIWKRKRGLKYKDEVDAANKAESELMKVMNPAGIAETPAPNAGAQTDRSGGLSQTEAENMLKDLERQARQSGHHDVDEWIGSIEGHNPHDDRIKAYNEVVKALYEQEP